MPRFTLLTMTRIVISTLSFSRWVTFKTLQKGLLNIMVCEREKTYGNTLIGSEGTSVVSTGWSVEPASTQFLLHKLVEHEHICNIWKKDGIYDTLHIRIISYHSFFCSFFCFACVLILSCWQAVSQVEIIFIRLGFYNIAVQTTYNSVQSYL